MVPDFDVTAAATVYSAMAETPPWAQTIAIFYCDVEIKIQLNLHSHILHFGFLTYRIDTYMDVYI